MKRKILWIGLSLLLVASLMTGSLLSSCSKTTTSTATTSASTTNNTPILGGTLTVFTVKGDHDPSGWDIPLTADLSAAAVWANPYLEWLTRGDIEKYGPGGNNQFAFNTWESVPEQYLTGELAESWEISTNPLEYTFHIRKGVMWTGNAKIGMAPRELNADDIAFSGNRSIARPGFSGAFTWLKSITATDKYTVVWQLNTFFANWPWRIGCGNALGVIMAPESVTAGANDWHNAVGTGPFILTDFVAGSGATYTKNPNYWGKTNINGKEYQLPFIDKLVYPIITDESTQIAALRTGKIDWSPKVKLVYQSTLTQNSPDLIQQKYLNGVISMLKLNRLTSKYFADKNIRRALMIGTDLNSIATLVYGGGEIVDWPIASNVPGYTPLDQLPASQKALYTYDPEKAKQMIADAGYPNGFSMEIATNSDSTNGDLCNALVSMWAKINVTASIKVMENTALTNAYNDVSYKDSITTTYGVVNPFVSLVMARWNYAGTTYKQGETPDFEQMFQDASAMVDPVQRTALIKSFSLAFLDDVAVIPFANTYVLNCYWPWLKNYHGELETGYYNGMPMIKRLWIDPNLKTSLIK